MQFWLSHLFFKYVIQLCNFDNLKKDALNTFWMNYYELGMITSSNFSNSYLIKCVWTFGHVLHLSTYGILQN